MTEYPNDLDSLRILSDILKPNYEGIDALAYRANHDNWLDLMDQLERDGLIKKEKDKYWLSLVAINILNNDYVKELQIKFETVFTFLKQFYKKNQKDQITIEKIAELGGFSVDQVRECISYMKEGSIWSSYPTDLFVEGDHKVKPSERILKYKSFQEVINEAQGWVYNRIKSQMKLNDGEIPVSAMPFFQGVLNDRGPDWIKRLEPEFQRIMNEIYISAEQGLTALPTMGLRTVIDMVCNDKVGDIGTFTAKLGELLASGFINANEKTILASALEMGHAATHRQHFPEANEVKTLIRIIEHLLEGIYILRPAAEKIKGVTPKKTM